MTDFSLLETMLWEPGTGIVRLRLHLARLQRSADQLGFPGAGQAHDRLAQLAGGDGPMRIRLALARTGAITVTTAPFEPHGPDTVWRVCVAKARLRSADTLLRHKTSRRAVYDAARAEKPAAEADEMLLLNEKGEPCEGAITSLFLDDGSAQLKTPPLGNGLLAGVLRTDLICRRKARVQRLTLDDLAAGRLYMGNSLRGLIRANLSET